MASKPRTGLRTHPSAAKCFEEPDFDVQNSPDPPKSAENREKSGSKSKKIRVFFFRKEFSQKKKSGEEIVVDLHLNKLEQKKLSFIAHIDDKTEEVLFEKNKFDMFGSWVEDHSARPQGAIRFVVFDAFLGAEWGTTRPDLRTRSEFGHF